MGTLKPQSNALGVSHVIRSINVRYLLTLLYSSTVIRTLAIDRWAVIFDTAKKKPGLWPNPIASSLYQMQQPIHQWQMYQLHIIRSGTIITFAL